MQFDVSHMDLLNFSRLTITLLIVLACFHPAVGADNGHNEDSVCQKLNPSPALEQFVDKLPRLQKIYLPSKTQVTLGTYKTTQKLHRDLPPTTLYAYGKSQDTAVYPGPTLIAEAGEEAHVRWENHIYDAHHMFTVDRSLMWANPGGRGGVPIVTHVHGAEAESASDGHPDTWYTAGGARGPKYVKQNYTYANSQTPAMLWYHDHSLGITRLNVLAGLCGLYIVRPAKENNPSWLPSGKFEVNLVLQDKQFRKDGSINFPNVGDSPTIHPNWCPEYFGDTIVVNGKAWPSMHVQPRKYRFRILNAASARFFQLSLSDQRVSILQIGTDGGLLYQPQNLSTVQMGPAERVDLIIDFSLVPGSEVILNNSAPAPFPVGVDVFCPPSTLAVLKFIVQDKLHHHRDVAIPQILRSADPVINIENAVWRNLKMRETDDTAGNPIYSLLTNHTWMDPATETPIKGSTEVWEIVNLTPDAHPMHIHLVQFRVLNQQFFNQALYESNVSCSLKLPYPHPRSCYTEKPRGPTPNQIGWKDTAVTLPSAVTRFVLHWTPRGGGDFPFDPTAEPGYVWHCHILDHEDNDMMRPIKVQN